MTCQFENYTLKPCILYSCTDWWDWLAWPKPI